MTYLQVTIWAFVVMTWAAGMEGKSALLALASALIYLGSCALWPFTYCWGCMGKGRHSRKDGKVWRNCGRCKGSGRRLRLGRKVWNYFAKSRAAASK